MGVYIRSNVQVLKCGAREGWRRSVKPIARKHEVRQRVKEESNIAHKTKRRKVDCVDHILLKNCILKHVTEGNIEGRISDGKTRKMA
jgi:ppGpp synthetase/RelA/SpoT-type nucleotidyltranferase